MYKIKPYKRDGLTTTLQAQYMVIIDTNEQVSLVEHHPTKINLTI